MIEIRLARDKDIQILQNLNDEVFVDNKNYDIDLDMNWAKGEAGKKYFSELVLRKDALCLIASDGLKNIGYLAASSKDIDYRNSKYAEIENMGVTPEYRGKGIGNLLMDKCVEWAKSNGYQKLFVTSYIANNGAVNFYKKNGFVNIDISLERTL